MSLPAAIEELVRLVGHGKTMALVREFGGQEIRIPKTDLSDTWHAFSEVIGERAMQKIAESLGGGEPMYLPLCHQALKAERNRRMIRRYDALLKTGLSGRAAVQVLVREFRPISYRQVEKIVNAPLPEMPATNSQGELF